MSRSLLFILGIMLLIFVMMSTEIREGFSSGVARDGNDSWRCFSSPTDNPSVSPTGGACDGAFGGTGPGGWCRDGTCVRPTCLSEGIKCPYKYNGSGERTDRGSGLPGAEFVEPYIMGEAPCLPPGDVCTPPYKGADPAEWCPHTPCNVEYCCMPQPRASWSDWSECQPSCGTQRTQTRTCLQSGDEGPCQPDADGMETTKSCSDNPCPTCKVPDFSTLNMVTAPTGGCTEAEVLQETKSCNVICNEASSGTSIMGTYKCSANGSMTGPNLTCTPKTCPLPSSFAKLGMTSASTNGCLPGGTLQEGDECGVICTAAYGKGSGTYKCSADGTLSGPGLTCVPNKCPALPSSFSDMGMMPAQSNPCSEGQILDENQQCNVTCMTDYSSGSTTTGTYACSANGSLSGPNLKCVENTCTLGTFGTGIEGANPSPCTSGGQLNAGQSCYLQCQTGYTYSRHQ